MTRKQLCINRMLAKKADVHRIYLPCLEGGRSLMNLEIEYKATMVGLYKYMTSKNDPGSKQSSDTITPRPFTLYQKKLQNTSVKLVHKTLL